MKQEKYQLAEYHFRRALEINPRNSVLHCYRGMALLSNRTYDNVQAMPALAWHALCVSSVVLRLPQKSVIRTPFLAKHHIGTSGEH